MLRAIQKKAFQQFKKLEAKSHELNYLFWECTARCNLNCLHCGSDCSRNPTYKDMPLDDFLAALDTLGPLPKHFIVVLTGGEPLLRPDLEYCGREIRKRGARWGMVTNGYLYGQEKQNALLNAGLGALTISLDGLEASHNWLRNTKIDYTILLKSIHIAAHAPRLHFDIVTCVNQRNIHELEDIYRLLVKMGVKAWRLFTIAPIGRAKHKDGLFLSAGQFSSLMGFIQQKRKQRQMDVKFSCEGYVGPYEGKVRDGLFFCRAGINIGSVLVDGSISACPNIDRAFVQGNIYHDKLVAIWDNHFQPFRDRSWTKTGPCANCKEYKYCQGNGMHLWHGKKKEVLDCHWGKITANSHNPF